MVPIQKYIPQFCKTHSYSTTCQLLTLSLLNNTIVQSLSRAVNSYLTGQRILFVWNFKIHYHVHKIHYWMLPLDSSAQSSSRHIFQISMFTQWHTTMATGHLSTQVTTEKTVKCEQVKVEIICLLENNVVYLHRSFMIILTFCTYFDQSQIVCQWVNTIIQPIPGLPSEVFL